MARNVLDSFQLTENSSWEACFTASTYADFSFFFFTDSVCISVKFWFPVNFAHHFIDFGVIPFSLFACCLVGLLPRHTLILISIWCDRFYQILLLVYLICNIEGLVQDFSVSNALAMEILQSSTMLSMWSSFGPMYTQNYKIYTHAHIHTYIV